MKIISIYQSYCVFSLLFSQNTSTKHDITSTEISHQFLALKSPSGQKYFTRWPTDYLLYDFNLQYRSIDPTFKVLAQFCFASALNME